MKKVILLLLIAAVVFSCKKNETSSPADKQQAEIAFNVTSIMQDAERWDENIPQCKPDAVPVQAKIKISELEGDFQGDGYFWVDIFYTNDSLYTKAIKVDITTADGQGCDDGDGEGQGDGCCTFTVEEFYLLDAAGDIIKAMPQPGSEFSEFVFRDMDPDYSGEFATWVTFEVCAFMKTEVYVDVLCFEPHMYYDFGFFWFNITEITIREMCFFGDICLNYWQYPFDLWQNLDFPNYYQEQWGGIQADMPAIFRIAVFHSDTGDGSDWEFIRYWDNEVLLGETKPLCLRYADYDKKTDYYKFELYIYGPWGPDGYFEYPALGNYQGCWTFTDNADPLDLDPDGDGDQIPDGVIDFAFGNCVENPEYQFPDDVCFDEPSK